MEALNHNVLNAWRGARRGEERRAFVTHGPEGRSGARLARAQRAHAECANGCTPSDARTATSWVCGNGDYCGADPPPPASPSLLPPARDALMNCPNAPASTFDVVIKREDHICWPWRRSWSCDSMAVTFAVAVPASACLTRYCSFNRDNSSVRERTWLLAPASSLSDTRERSRSFARLSLVSFS